MKIKLKADKKYSICSCGLSGSLPFCDNSHRKEGKFKSLKYLAEETKEIYFCGCKMTGHPPFCDGTHTKL